MKLRMKPLLLAAILLSSLAPAQAGRVIERGELQRSPYAEVLNERLKTMAEMATLLSHVRDTASAQAAAPRLLRKLRRFQVLQASAEDTDTTRLSPEAENRYIYQQEWVMNSLRMECLRLAREKYYDSPTLAQALNKLNQAF